MSDFPSSFISIDVHSRYGNDTKSYFGDSLILSVAHGATPQSRVDVSGEARTHFQAETSA